MKEDRVNTLLREHLDSELQAIEFNEDSQTAVFDKLRHKKRNKLLELLNYEIKIPIKQVIAAGCLSLVLVLGYSYINLRLPEEYIMNSEVEYIEICISR